MAAEDAVSDDEVEEEVKPLAKTAANQAAEASKVIWRRERVGTCRVLLHRVCV